MKLKQLLLLLACLLLPTVLCHAADEMTIRADAMSHSQEDDTVVADGNVRVEWGAMTLTSRRATYNRTTRIMNASGDVVIVRGDQILRGESATWDLNSGRGELFNGVANRRDSSLTITGDRIVRNEDRTLALTGTQFTTCDSPTPSWKLSGEKLDVDLDGYAVGRNIVFYVKDTPVMYLPWFAFPATRDRKSGLLFPDFGYSKKRGAQLDLPLYWAISPSQDATFDLDMQTKRGVGLGMDYRYLRKRGSEGDLYGYLIYDTSEGRWRGQLTQMHREILSPDLNLRSSVNLTTDRDFHRDFDVKSGVYNSQSNDTIVNALKTWQQYALNATLRYSQDLYADNNRDTLQTLPSVGLSAVRQELFSTPLYFDLDATASNFQRDNGPDGQRLYAFPRVSLVTGLPGYLNATIYAGLHLRGYRTSDIPDSSDVKESTANMIPEAGATLSASFSRVFDIDGERLKKLRHELIPEISYRYSPHRDQSRLPSYDYDDRILHQNLVYYGVTSLLTGRFQSGESTEYRDISRIRVTQGYSIEGSRRDELTMADNSHDASDLILESETWLHPQVRLLFDARYDFHDNNLSGADPGLEFDDKRGNSAGISYRMTRNDVDSANQVEYLEARLSTKYFNPWTFGYSTRYSFDKSGFLESVYSAEYRHQCWSLTMAVHQRSGNPSFSISFNLAGLSDINSSRH
jgi:LPS-assembly protein